MFTSQSLLDSVEIKGFKDTRGDEERKWLDLMGESLSEKFDYSLLLKELPGDIQRNLKAGFEIMIAQQLAKMKEDEKDHVKKVLKIVKEEDKKKREEREKKDLLEKETKKRLDEYLKGVAWDAGISEDEKNLFFFHTRRENNNDDIDIPDMYEMWERLKEEDKEEWRETNRKAIENSLDEKFLTMNREKAIDLLDFIRENKINTLSWIRKFHNELKLVDTSLYGLGLRHSYTGVDDYVDKNWLGDPEFTWKEKYERVKKKFWGKGKNLRGIYIDLGYQEE